VRWKEENKKRGLGMVVPVSNSALGKHSQEDLEFKAILGYIARPCLKKRKEGWALVAHVCNLS
jgi:hypothetical protein